jgi:gluconokinase
LDAAARENAQPLCFAYLRVTPEIAARRVSERSGHYMPAALVQSQFDTLEEPDDALTIDASQPLDAVVSELRAALAQNDRNL